MPASKRFSYSVASTLCVLVLLTCGCSGDEGKIKRPALGQVTGTVKLDGQPLADALVEFVPTGARSSIGRTDSAGKYTLEFDESNKGAAVGEHTVRITTKSPTTSPVEKVPARFNEKSELKKTVKEGENPPIDFELVTK